MNNNKQCDKSTEEALAWVARLRSDRVTLQDKQAFALWLGASPGHRQSMDQALALWDDLGVVRKFAIEHGQLQRAANGKRWLAAAASIAACLVIAVALWAPFTGKPDDIQLQTAKGERLEVDLPDGSIAELNTDTSLVVSYSDEQRHVALVRGEAWFKVQTEPGRPFHVDSGDARVTALGTAFNVYRHSGRTGITVTEGVVRVTELGETGTRAPSVEILSESQHLLTGRDGWSVSTPDMAQSQAWRDGQLIAREMPLPELLAQLMRYESAKIVVTDPAIATLTVSGVFDVDQPEATLSALAVSLGLQIQALDADTVQLLKADH